MPLSVRARLAILITVILVAVLLAYAALVRARDDAVNRDRYRLSVMHSADSLAILILKRYRDGEVLTLTEPADYAPTPTPMLREIVEGVPGFVWVLHRTGFTIYRSERVRDTSIVSPDSRSRLDSLVATIRPDASAEWSAVNGYYIGRVAGEEIQTLELAGGRSMWLYSVLVQYRVGGVNRVVVGRLDRPPPRPHVDLGLPFVMVIPLVILVAVTAAGLFARIALRPVSERIAQIINEVEAITDGRSLHRRLFAEGESEADDRVARLTATLNAMVGRLEQSFGGLRRFTADASHELKTPLTVLRADVERAMATQSDRREQLIALEEALAETTRMADLVDSLLTLARADEGRFDLHREPVDLEALVRDVYETALLLGESTDVTVSMAPPSSAQAPSVQVQGDKSRLRQLFLNLVTNAIKYTPPGGKVELALTAREGTASFSVRDSGIGIAAADLPHVFERFWRADQARSRVGERGGFGLGLSISQYIAQAHGGSLLVQSRLGRGSTFTVALPMDRAADSPAKS
jgi:signal transduction histidine kinase